MDKECSPLHGKVYSNPYYKKGVLLEIYIHFLFEQMKKLNKVIGKILKNIYIISDIYTHIYLHMSMWWMEVVESFSLVCIPCKSIRDPWGN